MAAYSTKDARLLIGTLHANTWVDSVNLKLNAVVDPFHPLGATFPTTYDTGLRTGELSFTALYDGVYSQFMGVPGSGYQTSIEVEGGTAGTRAYCFPTPKFSAAEVGLSPEQMHRWTPEVTVSGEVNHAFVAAPYSLRTTAGDTDAGDADGLASSTGATAFLHVASLSLDGYDNCIITPRDSADGITYADCSSAFTVTDKVAASLALTGTVDQYLSASWAYTGSGTSPSITFALYIARD